MGSKYRVEKKTHNFFLNTHSHTVFTRNGREQANKQK